MKRLIFAGVVLGLVGCSRAPESETKAPTPPAAPVASVLPVVASVPATRPAPVPVEQYGEAEVSADCKKKGLLLADTTTTNTARGTLKTQRWELPGAGVWMIVTYHDGQVIGTTTGHD